MKILLALVTAVSMSLVSCGGEKDVDKIGDAQLCLDKLDGTDADAVSACLESIEGMTGAGPDSLRCTAGFMIEGLANGQRVIQGFDRIGDDPNPNTTLALFEILSFTSDGQAASDLSNAERTFHACLGSGAKGATLLSSVSYLTMSLINYLSVKSVCGGTPVTSSSYDFTYYDLTDCLDPGSLSFPADYAALGTLIDSSTNDTAAVAAQNGIGSLMIAAARVACPEGGKANKEICGLFDESIAAAGGTSEPRKVATEFFVNVLELSATP